MVKSFFSIYEGKIAEFDDNPCVSFCVGAKSCIVLFTYSSSVLLLLGMDYESRIVNVQTQIQCPPLDQLGAVLSEPNRIEVLNLINKKGEVTIRDIEGSIGLAGANVYYHLSMMIRVGMVKTRNRGRTLLYSLNEKYFISAGNTLLQYGKINERRDYHENLETANH